MRLLIEGLALRKPAASAAHVHRQVTEVAEREGWRVDNLRARLDRCRVAGVHVIHLNRDIGDDRGGGVVGHEADRGTRPFGIGQGEI